jgi:hypothetical protein
VAVVCDPLGIDTDMARAHVLSAFRAVALGTKPAARYPIDQWSPRLTAWTFANAPKLGGKPCHSAHFGQSRHLPHGLDWLEGIDRK